MRYAHSTERWSCTFCPCERSNKELILDEDITSPRNYLMKYIAKRFVITDTRFSETFWTKEQLVFNALIRKNGYRSFQPSRKLQQVMCYDQVRDNSVWRHTGDLFGRSIKFPNGYHFVNCLKN